MPDWIDVATVDEFGPGQTRLVNVDDIAIGVFNIDGEYHAIEDVCSHEQLAMLGSGLDVDDLVTGGEILCPRHGARFCVKTGHALCPRPVSPSPLFRSESKGTGYSYGP